MPIYENKLVNLIFRRLLVKKFTLGVITLMLMLGITACSDDESTKDTTKSSNQYTESPVKISLKDEYNVWTKEYDSHFVYITAISENLIINKILLNKGHCKVNWKDNFFPFKLNYSKQMKVPYTCNIIKVDIQTNQGDWSVEY